jgi:hypothetical protein
MARLRASTNSYGLVSGAFESSWVAGTDLQEDFPEYPIRLLTEDGAEDNGYSVMTRFDIDGFLLPIVNRHHLSAFRNAFRSGLPRIFRRLLLQLGEFIESSFEGRGHGVALEKRYPANEVIFCLCINVV